MKNYKSAFGLLLTILALNITTSSSAQGIGEIRGRIVDSLTNEPITGATISYTVAGSLNGAISDLDGYFRIKPLNPGLYDLKFRFVGCNPKEMQGIRVNSDKSENIGDIHLGTGNLKVFVKIGYIDKLIDPEDPGAIPIGLADLKASPSTHNPLAIIALASPEIKTSPDGRQVYFRGERNEATMYIVDGVKTRDGILGIPGSAIGHMTVYTGGVPAKYGDFTGGVVVIETQSYFDIVNRKKREN